MKQRTRLNADGTFATVTTCPRCTKEVSGIHTCSPTALVLRLEQRIAELEAAKDNAYLERNQCVALIARLALNNGWAAGIARTAIEGWSDDWHGCVYIDLPTGQVSWHFHDSQAHLFAGLPEYSGKWDGHDTPEKYRRVNAALSGRG